MKLDTSKMERTNGYLQGGLEAVDPSLRDLPLEYKKKLSQGFYAINPSEINARIHGDIFYVSRKIDGHLQLAVFNGEQIYLIGRGGTVRTGLPCLEKAKALLVDQKVTSLIAGAELYMQRDDQRSRVYDVIAALSDEKMTNTLGLAFFDLLDLNGQSMKLMPYGTVLNKLRELFPKSGQVQVIETETVKSRTDIKYLFEKWVEEEGGEGVVVRGDVPFMYKIKPKHTFDVVVVGYAEGINDRKGKIKSLLFAFMREEGIYQIAGKVGNLSEEQREELLDLFAKKHVNSNYIETDNEGIAFHMVQPDTIIEVGCNDVMVENTYGEALLNNLVKFEDGRYLLYKSVGGVRFIFPVFERIREDKTNCFEDIRFAQLADLVYLPEESLTPEELPASKLLFREVYTKTLKGKTLVQKFVAWQTNKETVNPRYPKYVLYYTNFSPDRQEPLQNEIRISNNLDQIMALTQQFMQENVKKGWSIVTTPGAIQPWPTYLTHNTP